MAVTFEIKVIPQAGAFKLQLNKNGVLCCYVKSAPEAGKANKEIIKELAKRLSVAQLDIEIIFGLTTRKKVIKIHGALTQELIFERLGLGCQLKID